MYRWVDHALDVTADAYGADALPHIAQSMSDFTISTAFSGIGCAETAAQYIGSGLRKRLHLEAELSLKSTFAVEIKDENIAELLASQHRPACLLTNMHELLVPRVRSIMEGHCARMDWGEIVRVVQRTYRSLIKTRVWCRCHGKVCELRKSTLHVAGTTPQWSDQGARQGTNDPSILSFVCWICLMLVMQMPGILHENVELFPACISAFQDVLCQVCSLHTGVS